MERHYQLNSILNVFMGIIHIIILSILYVFFNTSWYMFLILMIHYSYFL